MKVLENKGAIENMHLSSNLVIAGLDEVGRGCIAGPVTAGCVVLDYIKLHQLDSTSKNLIRDSKTLTKTNRSKIIHTIKMIAVDYTLAHATEREIETLGILNATFLAMNRCISNLSKIKPDILLVDGNQKIKNQSIPQQCIIKGDSLCYSIAAASILAKDYRDNLMQQYSYQFNKWGFDNHVGYGTKEHLNAIRQHGICTLHRKNFAPIKNINLQLNEIKS